MNLTLMLMKIIMENLFSKINCSRMRMKMIFTILMKNYL